MGITTEPKFEMVVDQLSHDEGKGKTLLFEKLDSSRGSKDMEVFQQ